MSASPHYLGHRQRLRRRLLDSKPQSLPEYEILEILLFAGNARQDVKPLAKLLIKELGSFANVLHANEAQLMTIPGVNETQIAHLRAVREAILHTSKAPLNNYITIDNSHALIGYLTTSLRYQKTEQYRVLYTDAACHILADELQDHGDISHITIYPRQIVKRALELQASGILLSHNHPSGDPTPSKADLMITNRLQQICDPMGISLHDHIIIAGNTYLSFREKHLLRNTIPVEDN